MIEVKYKITQETNTITLPITINKNKNKLNVYAYFYKANLPLSNKVIKQDGYCINNLDAPTQYNYLNENTYDIYKNILIFKEKLPKDLTLYIKIRSKNDNNSDTNKGYIY